VGYDDWCGIIRPLVHGRNEIVIYLKARMSTMAQAIAKTPRRTIDMPARDG
jgi:hypothetical protein